MNSKTITLIVAVNLLILLVLTLLMPHLMISPGKPIDAHAKMANDCFACHTPFIGSTADKCITCHKVPEISLKTTKGLAIEKEKKSVAFHQKLTESDCVACHSDHKGVKAFRPISQFSHKLLEPELEKQCNSCHNNPKDSLHQKIKGNCQQCHSQESWQPATFEHDKFFRFDRDHETDCETCHINNDYSDYTCYGCHEHSRSKIREEHVEEGIYDYEKCSECHRSGDEHEAERLWKSKRYGGSDNFERSYKKKKHDDDDD